MYNFVFQFILFNEVHSEQSHPPTDRTMIHHRKIIQIIYHLLNRLFIIRLILQEINDDVMKTTHRIKYHLYFHPFKIHFQITIILITMDSAMEITRTAFIRA